MQKHDIFMSRIQIVCSPFRCKVYKKTSHGFLNMRPYGVPFCRQKKYLTFASRDTPLDFIHKKLERISPINLYILSWLSHNRFIHIIAFILDYRESL